MRRAATALQTQYEMLLARFDQSQGEDGFFRSNARMIEQATPPRDRLVDLLMRSIPRSPPVQISGQDGNGARVDRMRSLRLSLTGGRGQEAPDITCAVPRANACTIAV